MKIAFSLLRVAATALRSIPLTAVAAIVAWSVVAPHAKLKFHVGNHLLAVASVRHRLHVMDISFTRPLPKMATWGPHARVVLDTPKETVRFRQWTLKVWCPGVTSSFEVPFAALKAPLRSRTLGFFYEKIVWARSPTVVREFQLPHWPLAVAGAVIAFGPVVLRGRRTRRHRARLGLCIACGYDLRGTPGDRCSECGARRS